MRVRNTFSEATTSLIDLAFILILFLALTLVFTPETTIPLVLPNDYTGGEKVIEVGDELMIQIDRAGGVYGGGERLAPPEASDSVLYGLCDRLLANLKAQKPETRILIRADSGAVWDRPIQIMQATGRHGLGLSIALNPHNIAGQKP
jgi:biopolymer transport protein ExbD